MDEVTTTRRLVPVKQRAQRKVAKRLEVSRDTVKRYVEGAPVGMRTPSDRARPKSEAVEARMKELLEDSPGWTAGKQRLTATRLWRMLKAEGHGVGVTLVKDFVREWKRELAEVFEPLTYKSGDPGVATSCVPSTRHRELPNRGLLAPGRRARASAGLRRGGASVRCPAQEQHLDRGWSMEWQLAAPAGQGAHGELQASRRPFRARPGQSGPVFRSSRGGRSKVAAHRTGSVRAMGSGVGESGRGPDLNRAGREWRTVAARWRRGRSPRRALQCSPA